MPSFLPPNLLALFAPRPPLRFEKPYTKLPWDKPREGKYAYDGVSDLLDKFEKAEDQPLPIREETKEERKARIRGMQLEQHKREMQDELLEWDPNKNREATVDPYKTLFVARLDHNTSEKRIKHEFEQFGRVVEVKLVLDKQGKSKGYAFVEYDNEKDMRYAYKQGGNIKLDGRQLLVDVERGRTVEGWRPRRFGGGLGDTRAPKKKGERKSKHSVAVISLHDHIEAKDGRVARTTIPNNHRYNKYDSEDRGGGSFTKTHRNFDGAKDKEKSEEGNRARFHPRGPPERKGLQYSRGGFDFGDGGFFGTDVQRFDSRNSNWKGNKERKGSGNRNHDEDMGGISRYSEKYIPSGRDDRPRAARAGEKREYRERDSSRDSGREWDKGKRPHMDDDGEGGDRPRGSGRHGDRTREQYIPRHNDSKEQGEKRDYTMANDGWGGGKLDGKVGSRYNVGRIAALGTRELASQRPRYREVKREGEKR